MLGYARTVRSWRLLFIAILVVAGGAVAALATSAAAALTCTKTWVGPANGSYNASGNWSPSGVPASADVVCSAAGSSIRLVSGGTSRTVAGANLLGSFSIESGMTFTVSSTEATASLTSTMNNLNVAGTLAGTHAAIVTGTSNLAGTIRGTGLKTVVSGAILNVAQNANIGANDNAAAGHGKLRNEGTINIPAGTLYLGGGSIGTGPSYLENAGTLNVTDAGHPFAGHGTTRKPYVRNLPGGTITAAAAEGGLGNHVPRQRFARSVRQRRWHPARSQLRHLPRPATDGRQHGLRRVPGRIGS